MAKSQSSQVHATHMLRGTGTSRANTADRLEIGKSGYVPTNTCPFTGEETKCRKLILTDSQQRHYGSSCELQSTTFRLASTKIDSVANGQINCSCLKQMKVCKMDDFGASSVWREAMELVVIKTFLETHRDVFDLEGQGEKVMMRLRSTTHSTGGTKDQRQAHRRPSRTMVEWRRNGQVHWNTSAVCLSTL